MLGKLYDVSAGNANFMYPAPKDAPFQGNYVLGARTLNKVGYNPALPIILTSARQEFTEKDGKACLVWSLFEAKQVMNVKAKRPARHPHSA